MGTREPIPYGQRDCGALGTLKFPIAEFLKTYARRASSTPSGVYLKEGTGGLAAHYSLLMMKPNATSIRQEDVAELEPDAVAATVFPESTTRLGQNHGALDETAAQA
jgi:hypothetical protein